MLESSILTFSVTEVKELEFGIYHFHTLKAKMDKYEQTTMLENFTVFLLLENIFAMSTLLFFLIIHV